MTITVIPMTMINILAWINEKKLMKIISFFMKKKCLFGRWFDAKLDKIWFKYKENNTVFSEILLCLFIPNYFLVLWIDDLPKLLLFTAYVCHEIEFHIA